MATQADIARKLGVSRQAVGFALGDNPRLHAKLNPGTCDRIRTAAQQLGYRPHRSAQLLRKRKSGVIGMIQRGGMAQLAMLRAFYAAQAVYRNGYNLLTNDVLWNEDGMRKACEAMLDAQVEGVIVMNTEMTPADLDLLRTARIPMVQVAGVQRLADVPQVRADARQGMRDLTVHLLGLGYRRLSLITAWGDPQHGPDRRCWPTADRVDGFRDAVGADGEVVFEETPFDWMLPYQQGLVAMRKLLKRAERPEVLLCTNDDWAIGALRACAEAGVRVPEDVAVTGFDDSVSGRFSMVPLTTVAQQPAVMSRLAVEILLGRIKGDKRVTEESLVKVPCQLVVRQSCGADLRQSPREIHTESQ